MKPLYKYIYESRQRIGKVPFSKELFKGFIEHGIFDVYDDAPEWQEIEQIITKEYGPRVWNVFKGWAESYREIYKDVTPEEFYDKMLQIPLDRVNRSLGAGSFGVAMELGNDKIIKVFYAKELNPHDKKFYEWCQKNNSHYFPKVYKLGKNWVVMEKLSLGTQKCKKLNQLVERGVNGKSMDFLIRDKYDISNFNEDQLWAYNWTLECLNEFAKIDKEYYGDGLNDFNIKNIGERKNGDIILFDP